MHVGQPVDRDVLDVEHVLGQQFPARKLGHAGGVPIRGGGVVGAGDEGVAQGGGAGAGAEAVVPAAWEDCARNKKTFRRATAPLNVRE
jgi:hypothetical protein